MGSLKGVKMVIKYIKLYYNHYEKMEGRGFYPLTFRNNFCDSEIIIGFEFINGVWKQYNESCIRKLSNEEYKKLLDLLNDSENNSNIILDRLGYLI